ncbi:T9SS type A sorting domain-containing protein [Ferruginibacter sp. SUN106]|uniref:T9SS type A sorting domain-containing protein n=1 Tax=Ferruginibacter sp. SUN106 TaxID=2978348 RepID=UPI003D360BD8
MKITSLQNSPLILFSNSLKYFLHLPQKIYFSGLLVLSFFCVTNVNAQVNSYSFSTTTGNVLETGGFTNLLGSNLDDDFSAMANIGFTFNFGGANYTNFSVTSNGLLAFGISATTEYDNNISSITGPYLAPYWDDNITDVNGNVQYKLMGVAGSRKLVVEYNLSAYGSGGGADKHFQVWLFETSNKIMFVYGNGNNTNSGFSVAVLTDGNTDFMSINTATNTVSTITQEDNNTTWPGAGTSYIINGAILLPVSIVNFSGYKDGNRNQLQWTTATENNNLGFELQRSADGITYTAIGFVNSLAQGGNSSRELNYTFTDNNPIGSRQYYRFSQVDINNHSKLSNVVRIDGDKPLVIKVDGVFPNPAITTVNIQVNAPAKSKLTVYLVDNTGRVAMQQDINVETGKNIVPIDISKLANANYTLKVSSGLGNAAAFKVMVIK